jgi:hypothetical protein
MSGPAFLKLNHDALANEYIRLTTIVYTLLNDDDNSCLQYAREFIFECCFFLNIHARNSIRVYLSSFYASFT